MTSDESPQAAASWLTEQELARWLQISIRHLIRLRGAGLPCVKLGTAIRYNAAEVEEYLRDNPRLPSPVVRPDKEGDRP